MTQTRISAPMPLEPGEPWLDPDAVVVNGVMASDSTPVVPRLAVEDLCRVAQGHPLDSKVALQFAHRRESKRRTLGAAFGIDTEDLGQAGWGVVFAADDPDAEAMRLALAPLLEKRKNEADQVYREYVAAQGLRADESGWSFLERHGSPPGPVEPSKMPYYLLLVGDAARISFDSQCQLDSRHAVGRLHFDGPTLGERLALLHRYSRDVVKHESAQHAMPRRALFFATRNAGDAATQRSARLLAGPVAETFAHRHAGRWSTETALGADATKNRLVAALRRSDPPNILFSATHGVGFQSGDSRQLTDQGALVCQDWPGPLAGGPITDAMYLAAEDVKDSAPLDGMLALIFACYGAGTPAVDLFLRPSPAGEVAPLAPVPFVARLPQQLLVRGAGAVVGHVERAWSYSFMWPQAGTRTAVFESFLDAVASGRRVGSAMDTFNDSAAQIAQQLGDALRENSAGKHNESDVARLWTAQTDSKYFVILGDPACRV